MKKERNQNDRCVQKFDALFNGPLKQSLIFLNVRLAESGTLETKITVNKRKKIIENGIDFFDLHLPYFIE